MIFNHAPLRLTLNFEPADPRRARPRLSEALRRPYRIILLFSIDSFTFSPWSHRAQALCLEVYYYPSPCTDCYPTRCKLCVSSLYSLIGQRCGWWLIAAVSRLLKKASMCSYEQSSQSTLSRWSFKPCASFPSSIHKNSNVFSDNIWGCSPTWLHFKG